MVRVLKVFSTAAGFYEAVVAAPSQKAALEAWGVRENLFATGAAKQVEDPALIAQALAQPGKIVRVPISPDAGFIAAAKPPTPPPAPSKSLVEAPPDRTALTAAEAMLDAARGQEKRAFDTMAAERAAAEARYAERAAKLTEDVNRATKAVEAARAAFEGGAR